MEPALFDTVQSLLRARTAKMTRHVQHAHHLKGLLHCGTCGSRMLLDFATNPRGVTYAYFVCSGRASKKTGCTRRAVPVAVAERLVADSYASITINDQTYRDLAAKVDAAFDKRMAGRDQEIADLMANRAKLESESDKLLAAHFADAIDLPTLKRHQDRIRAGLADVNQKLAEHDEHHTGGRAFLHDSLRLLTDAHHAYARSGDADRRLANQAFYTRLDITDDEQLRPRLAEPFATIIREAHEHSDDESKEAEHKRDEHTHVACSRKTLWVETKGLEPSTSTLQRSCAASCATSPVVMTRTIIAAPRGAPDQSVSCGPSQREGSARAPFETAPHRPRWHRPTTLDAMWSKREVIDYALQRRNTLQALRRSPRTLSRSDACDADPMLIRAALHHGEDADRRCPICEARMVNLHYVFGEQLGQYSGRIKSSAELTQMQSEFGEFTVRVVEVCTDCGWNHMITAFLLGDGVTRRPPRRQKTVEDIYG